MDNSEPSERVSFIAGRVHYNNAAIPPKTVVGYSEDRNGAFYYSKLHLQPHGADRSILRLAKGAVSNCADEALEAVPGA